MATIKKGKAAQPEERLLTQIIITENKELVVKLWNTKLERMETIQFTSDESQRINLRLGEDEK